MKRKTDKIELVETGNLALSLTRLNGAPYDSEKWRRALYHAIAMSSVCNFDQLRAIREALNIP